MSKKVYPLIFGLLISVFSYSQEKVPFLDLIQEIEITSDIKQKLVLLDSLSKEIYKSRRENFDTYKKTYPKYCLQYINLAKELKDFDKAAYKTSKLTNFYLQEVGKADSAAILVNNIINDSTKIKDRINLGHLYVKRAGAYYQIENLEIAVKDYNSAQKIYHDTQDTIYEADAIFFSGQSYERLGDLTKAILKYQSSQRLYGKMKDTAFIAYTGMAISNMYSQLYLVELSLKEREKIKKLLLAQKHVNFKVLSELSVLEARDYRKKKAFKKEEAALLHALELVNNKGGFSEAFRLRGYLSEFYAVQNKPEIGRKYLDTMLLNTDLIHSKYDRIFYLKALSRLKLAEGAFDEAITVFEEEIAIFKQSNDIRGQLYLEEELYKANKKINRLAEALDHMDRYMLLKDSLYNIARSNSVIYYQTLYETEKRDNKIALQRASIEVLESKSEARKSLLIFGSIGLSLFFLSIYLYRNKVLLLRNKKQQQSFLQELLQTQERMSKRISKDLHDSVGQSLLLIKNRLTLKEDPKTVEMVNAVIDETRGISRTLHPFKLEEMGLTITLQSSVEMIDENYDIFISAEIDNIDKLFDQEQEINIYRLVQESFNNIIKHSNAKSAEIKVLNKIDNVEIVIKDNGKGFDVTTEKLAVSKIGLKTLSERSKFLRASFNILSEINIGTTLIFNIPKYE